MGIFEPQAGVKTYTLIGAANILSLPASSVTFAANWTRWNVLISSPTLPDNNSFFDQTPAANYPSTTTSNLYTTIPGVAPEVFQLGSIGTPQLVKQENNGTGNVVTYSLQVTVAYPKWYYVRRRPQIDFGNGFIAKVPGELHNLHVRWRYTTPSNPGGVELRFFGGVQGEYVNPAVTVYGLPTPSGSTRGRDIAINANYAANPTSPDEIYGVGWTLGAIGVEHGFKDPAGANYSNRLQTVEGKRYWDYDYLTDAFDISTRLPNGITHTRSRMVVFKRNGGFSAFGSLFGEEQNFQGVGLEQYQAVTALAEQRTAFAVNGTLAETAYSLPFIFNGLSSPPLSQRNLVCRTFSSLAVSEDSSVPASSNPFVTSPLCASGIVLASNPDRLCFGTWWQESDLAAPNLRTTRRQRHKAGARWFAKYPASDERGVETPVPVGAMRVRLFFAGPFVCWLYYEWADATHVLSEDGITGPLNVKLMRGPHFKNIASNPGGFPSTAITGSYSGAPETFAVAQLDRLPEAYPSVFEEDGVLYFSEGRQAWKSRDMGATWNEHEIEDPFPAPRYAIQIDSYASAWMALGLELGEIGEAPTLFFRRSFDRGTTWEDETEVGQLDGAIWGATLAQWQDGSLIVAYEDRLRWQSKDLGTTWEEI